MAQATKATRENRTITVDFHDESTYWQLLDDGKAFVEFVLAFVLSLGFQLAHKSTCDGGGSLTRHSAMSLDGPSDGRSTPLKHPLPIYAPTPR